MLEPIRPLNVLAAVVRPPLSPLRSVERTTEMSSATTAGRASQAGRLSAFAALWAALRMQRRPDAPAISRQLLALPRMLSGALKGTYTGMERSRLAMMALAVAYIVSPVDLMPESIFLIFGLGDDAVVLTWLAGAILSETEAFLDWEDEAVPAADPHRVVPSEVV